MRYYPLLCLLPISLAFELPFKVSSFFSSGAHKPAQFTEPAHPNAAKIAIIGAGAGGSSAAFWISKAIERFGLDIDVDVYERNNYIGGRSTTVHPHNNDSLPELELGASIFVEANKNLLRASHEFNLTRRNFQEENYETAIWDGDKFVLQWSGSWWDTAKLLWRYGYRSPKRTETIIKSLINGLDVVYGQSLPKWDSINTLVNQLGWLNDVNTTTSQSFSSQGISDRYIYEIIEAATRVNYGQNADVIHAVEGACSMAANGAMGIAGGNFQLFEQFLNRSQARVLTETTVHSITPKQSKWSIKSSQGTKDYKAVIIAAPFHSTGIQVPLSVSEQIPEQPYVHLHVTLLATTSPSPNPEYFGLDKSTQTPRVILTTYQGARAGGKAPEFNSLTYHGLVREGEWAVKIFSEREITDEWLEKAFPGSVTWVHRKQWKAYPHLPPTTTFPPVKLDQGLYYVNAFEPFISTMETETISSRNVVELLLNDEFNVGLCSKPNSPEDDEQQVPVSIPATVPGENFVYGWDC